MNLQGSTFTKHILSKENKIYLFLATVLGIIYFITLRTLYPIPSYYSDSFTWVGAAANMHPVSFRPIGYSQLLLFFKLFSSSDVALIAAQYFCNLLANLFLFFTCTWFFNFKIFSKILLFVLLIINPLYLFHSNYVSSDAFFNCFTVLWFTLLMWFIHQPSWKMIIAQMLVLAGLFTLRYNAIFFPVIAAFALCLSTAALPKKIVGSVGTCMLVITIMIATTYVTKTYTGTRTFSAFSGWQLANNALHIVHNQKIDTTAIKDKEVKALVKYTVNFFDTSTVKFTDTSANAYYMWDYHSPLKRYMNVYPRKQKKYFLTWNALGPLYSKMGSTIILQNPVAYTKYFVLPNAQAYLFPRMEIYETYMENRDTIASIATKFYGYKNNQTPGHHPKIYAVVFTPMKSLFTIVNILFVVLSFVYFISKTFKNVPRLFNQTLLVFSAFYIANFFFIVLLAPSVFRYHIPILTLSFPFLLYLAQQLIFKRAEINNCSDPAYKK